MANTNLNPTSPPVSEKFTAEANIARHEAKGLRMTVIMLKRKQRKGVRLNLFDGESARPLLVSPNKLSQLKEELAAKKTKKQREEEEKELRKNRAEEERKRKEAEKQERSVQNQVNVQLRRERKKLEDDQKAVRKSEREAKKTKKANGQSASLTTTGTLDSQTALLRGQIESNHSDDFIFNERVCGTELCAWAKEIGVDGIMRMNAGFETLICDFSASSLTEALNVNITVPGKGSAVENAQLPQDPNRRPPQGIGNYYAEQTSWEWIRSGTWHYGGYANGGQSHREQRVRLDKCGMVTFYDPRLKSPNEGHHGGIRGNDTYQNGWGLRRGHRLLGITMQDSRKVKE
ncbi:hypothetical protein MMC14_006759 [Varicellaria rhodocarpa]|nr:hypothetical protein [Varicellaria rhodocarpa]